MDITIVTTTLTKIIDPATKRSEEKAETVETVFEVHPHELLSSVATRFAKAMKMDSLEFHHSGNPVASNLTVAIFRKKIGDNDVRLYAS